MAGRSKDTDMTRGVIWKQLMEFAMPMMLGLLFQQLYNTVDTIVVGQFVSKQALAAVGSTNSIINTIVGFASGLAVGAGVVISQSYGAHDQKQLSDSVHTSIAMTLVLSVLLSVIGVLLVNPLLRMMSVPEDVHDDAFTYLTIYFAGMTGVLMYNIASGVLRAVGDSRRPLYFLIISAVLNTVLDLLFVIVFKMGVAGVAYATVIANVVSAVLELIVLMRDEGAYRLYIRRIGFHGNMLRRIISIGLPSALQQAITAFSNVFVQGYINYFGSDVMAGYAAYNKLESFMNIPMQGFGMAASTFVGQNYGANKLKRAAAGVRSSIVMVLSSGAILAILLEIFAGASIQLFTSDENVVRIGAHFVRIISPLYVLAGMNQIRASALRGIGRSTAPMIAMLSSFVAFRQVYLYLVRNFFGNGMDAIVMGYPAGWVVCVIVLFFMYRASELGHAGRLKDEAEEAEA